MHARLKTFNSPSYAILNLLAGYSLILSGSSLAKLHQSTLLIWWGTGMFLIGAAYLFSVPGVFGKKAPGNRSWLLRAVLFPTLALNYAIWHLRHRIISTEDTCNLVAPGVWLGRRPLEHELPPSVRTVVDLTCEMTASPSSRKLNYICLPILDGCAPSVEALFSLVVLLQRYKSPLYIHCAAGHGRSAMVAVALLVARGHAHTLEEAEEMVRSARPAISIKAPQQAALKEWHARWIKQIENGGEAKSLPFSNEDLIPDVHIEGQKLWSLLFLLICGAGVLATKQPDPVGTTIMIVYWFYLAGVILQQKNSD